MNKPSNEIFDLKEWAIIDKNLEYFGFSSLQLMENAGREIAFKILNDFPKAGKIIFFIGPGRNGGDAAVAARHLIGKREISVCAVGNRNDFCNETEHNLLLIMNAGTEISFSEEGNSVISAMQFDLAVDGLFGTGFIHPMQEPFTSSVKSINSCRDVASIDIESPGVRAKKVYSIEVQKAKNAEIIKIGIPEAYFSYVGPANVKLLSSAKQDSHKGENGQVLIIGGSMHHHGALIFAAEAASKFCDLAYCLSTKENIPSMKKNSLHSIVDEISIENIESYADKCSSILIGPGLETGENERKLVNDIAINYTEKNLIFDASALRLLNQKNLHENCLVTPHKNEFLSLFGTTANEKTLMAEAKKHGCTILLKGRIDLICDGDKIYRNFTGNEGMTVGGTGDMLAGLCAAFASRNSILDSARAAAFLSGMAGDMIYDEVGANFNAMDVINELARAKKWCEDF